jgi:hypothetical protein
MRALEDNVVSLVARRPNRHSIEPVLVEYDFCGVRGHMTDWYLYGHTACVYCGNPA